MTHPELVKALVKSPLEIRMDPDQIDLVHAILGISGEAGELLDQVKKHVIYNKALDRGNMVEELGDLEFYMEQLRQRLKITREECIEHNIAKLSKRYSQLTYTDKDAQERADKV